MNKGQASIEALLILAAVLIAVASLQVMGRNTNETVNARAAARDGVQSAITKLAIQYGVDIDISAHDMDGDNIIFYLTVQGNPPPDNNSIIEAAKDAAENQLEQVGAGDYEVTIIIDRRVAK